MSAAFFENSFGVFQGGGVRATAFAGAFRETHAAGIRHTAVAGASAGSIAAVLVAAGATPDQLEEALLELDFCSLLKKPEERHRFSESWPRFAGTMLTPFGLLSKRVNLFSKVLRYGGCYSSQGIEEWIDERLRSLLQLNRRVKFRDLRIPAYIVATDLGSNAAKVWSCRQNPDDSVALAVRASCSIPLFFQPVLIGDSRIVDGGMLSNLPTFTADDDSHIRSRRVLAYRLVGAPPAQPNWTVGHLLRSLIDTVVSGAAELQVQMHRQVSCIDIPIDDLAATDFHLMDSDRKNRLIETGASAARQFLESGLLGVRQQAYYSSSLSNLDEVYGAIAAQSDKLPEEVLISEASTDWYWQLFPSVLFWRARGVPVSVLLEAATGDAHNLSKEQSRRSNLRGMGIAVKEVNHLPLRAYLFLRSNQQASTAVLFTKKNSHEPLATVYDGPLHQVVIHLLAEKLTEGGIEPATTGFRPSLVPVPPQDVLTALKKGVSQYSSSRVTLTWERIPISEARSITKLVRGFKYKQMLKLVQLWKEYGIEPFSATAVVLDNGRQSLMGPPVFEFIGNSFVGVEGNTRTLYAHLQGDAQMHGVVVRGVSDPLPGHSVTLSEMTRIDTEAPIEERMPGFKYDQFRRIEGACHPHR